MQHSDPVIENLKPYFTRKGARQRVILYLLLSQSVDEICTLTIANLKAMKFPPVIEFEVQRLLDERGGKDDDLVFVFNENRPLPPSFIYNLLRSTTSKINGQPLMVDAYRSVCGVKKGVKKDVEKGVL
jgi:hypothetical protein